MLSRFVAVAACCLVTLADAAPPMPAPVLPDTLHWGGPPGNPLVRGAWLLGAEDGDGLYAFRVELKAGARLPVHTHPDTRYSTVLSGTLYVGFGEQADDARMVAVPAGAVYVAPAGQPHYLHARDGDVIYQEGGFGPTATTPVAR
ncbi:MAG: cupin domain-containing protein [Rhodocyclaceae bacterium]|nr:cupin domain-containing protein [Rhodocyclaceae bacterium]